MPQHDTPVQRTSPPVRISRKAQDIRPFLVMDVLERAQAIERDTGVSVIHLEVGEPDFDTPPAIVEAASKAMRDGDTHYTHSLGLLELREAIVAWYHTHYRVSISPEHIIVTSGSSPAILLVLATLLDPGDEVILSDPRYACYANFIRLCDGVSVDVTVDAAEGFQYTAAQVRPHLTSRTKALLINSPANPTGTVLAPSEMARIAEVGPLVISDEIYHGLVYEGRAHSILEYTNQAWVLNGFSKLFAMTGWRLGYVIAPARFVRAMQKIQQNLFISAGAFVQRAGIAALQQAQPEAQRMVEIYDQRRRVMLAALRDIGFGVPHDPTGAFYVFADATRFGRDSYTLAFDILEHAKVAVAPGIDFGANGEGYLRFSYANSLDNIREGLRRLKQYLRCGISYP
ncbi:MAG TPA: pyridoxal phosphate-dependent aminotransferase [Candidatus Tectomicrobia bacterium]|nr:pyridoxal phosphate-dependent aminotransferase [Candidatus Tectomicrobia bacterium]